MSKVSEIKGTPADVVVDEALNISRAQPIEERQAEVIGRAIDLFDNGQTQPVRCFPGKGGKPTVYIGFTRTAAVELIRRGFSVPTGEIHMVAETDAEGKPTGKEIEQKVTRTIHDENFPLIYTVDDLTEDEAVIRGTADNYQNNKPNDLDLARTAKGLQERFQWSDAEVTRRLNISDPFKIGRIKKLLNAPAVIQDAVAKGKLATAAALEIVTNTSGEGRKAAVAAVKEAVESDKRAPTQSLIKKIATEAMETAERKESGRVAPRGPTSAPTAPEIRAFVEEWVKSVWTKGIGGGDDAEGMLLHEALIDLRKYLNGKITEKTLVAKFDDHFGVATSTKLGKYPEEEIAKETAQAETEPVGKKAGRSGKKKDTGDAGAGETVKEAAGAAV